MKTTEKITDLFVNVHNEAIDDATQKVMDLFNALRELKGKASLKDLVKLAKRIRSLKVNQ